MVLAAVHGRRGTAATLGHPDVDIQVVQSGGKDVGILELDFRVAGQCELTFMGLTAECGQGPGPGADEPGRVAGLGPPDHAHVGAYLHL